MISGIVSFHLVWAFQSKHRPLTIWLSSRDRLQKLKLDAKKRQKKFSLITYQMLRLVFRLVVIMRPSKSHLSLIFYFIVSIA
jgi:hypothetical protein